MSSTGIESRWLAHHEQRHAWAFRVYDAFMDSLSAEIRERLLHRKNHADAYVVVFGTTQVGKTTLVTDLMGVAPSAMPRVSTVLRGGRAEGRSATPTALEYERSPDDRWGLRVQGDRQWFTRDEQMIRALADLRLSMEAHRLVVDQPCVVSVPRDCFATDRDLRVRILDLPGDAPQHASEASHVQEMARRYVPLADLILLVGRSDGLGFLKPGALTLPGIEDWQSVPSRFRIVTTYSFTPKSAREFIGEQPHPLQVQALREHLIAQIEIDNPLTAVARQPQRFFPLEFGRSWDDEANRNPDLHARVSPLIEALREQLLADIRESTTPLARLKGAVLAHEVVAHVKQRRLEEFDQALRASQLKFNRLLGEHATRRDVIRRKLQKLARQKLTLQRLSKEYLAADLAEHLQLPGQTTLGDAKKRVSGYQSMIIDARHDLRRRGLASRPCSADGGAAGGSSDHEACLGRRRFWEALEVDDPTAEIEAILDEVFEPFRRHLKDSYWWLDSYLSTGPNSRYRADGERLHACVDLAERRLLSAARRWWRKAARQEVARLIREHEAGRGELAQWRDDARRSSAAVSRARQTVRALQIERLEFCRRMDRDLDESRRFNALLEASYLAELKRQRKLVMRRGEAAVRFVDLLGAVQRIDARHALARVSGDA
ncbi:MAG: hypothetical protein M0Z99_19005 [Betaproteobacteria bacterium]|nr:hypothetical protein [Betaproteobacteria bacterium]